MFKQVRALLFLFVLGGGALLIGIVPHVRAASANISHSYSAAAPIETGSLVSLDKSRSDYVVAANTSNSKSLLGVLVSNDDSILAISPTSTKVQVAISGTASALVSDINGAVKVDNQIAVSPFDGIGMNSLPGAHIIGVAQTNLGDNKALKTERVVNKSGQSQTIHVGYIRLQLAIGIDTTPVGGTKVNSLQKLVKSMTGHTISTVRIIISVAVALAAVVSIVTLIYSSIFGSMISIGRNPLAKLAIFRALTSVMGMVVMTALVAGVAIFFLLR